MKNMKKIYQKLALTGVLAALLLSAGCGGAKETSADETAGNVPAVAEQKTDSKADMELSETLEVDAGSSEAGTETLETNTETQTQGYTFTDDLGREVTVKSADRVATLIGSFTDVWMLAGGNVVAAANDSWESLGLDLDESVVNLGSILEPDVEQLIAAEPDFVIASANTDADVAMEETLTQAGITVAYFDVANFEDYLNMLSICTQITGRDDLYQKNGLDVQKEVEEMKQRADGSNPTVLFLRAASSNVKAKGSDGNVCGEMLADLGCVNIADSDESLLDDISMEAIIAADPQYIFVTIQGNDSDAAMKNVDDLLTSNPAWASLTAVKNDHYYILDKRLFNLKPNAKWGEAYKQLAEKVKPFGAKITIIAPDIMDKLKQDPAFMCEERPFVPEDIEGCAFVIAATDDRELNHRISALCQEKGILVNVVDDKDYCGFLFPSLVKEGKLTAGISTAGASPQIAAELRSRMARELPNQMEEILDYLESIREPAKKMIADDRIRARFLKETAQLCMDENRVPDEEETRQRIRDYCQSAEQTGLGKIVSTGMVTLVGAGCGAYDLITLRGLNAIRRAEVLVYDDLIDARLLDHASESCEKIYVGKRIGVHSREQEEINAILIEHAKKGKRVVRLKGGDPFVFGRGSEEMEALKAKGIPVTEVPGITSAIAVPAAAGIPVTHRGKSRSFHVVTAHTKGTADSLPEGLKELVAVEGTLVFLMGMHQLSKLAGRLMEYGKSPETPAAVVQGNFDGKTVSVRGTLFDIAEKVKESGMQSPAVIVIGETAEMEL
jgi:uroporphyrin-III C-methyltransferase